MKIWHGYGSEHSMNLVMIGRFRDAGDAAKAKEVIDQLTEHVRADEQAGLMATRAYTDRFPDGMLDFLKKVNICTIGPTELEQFGYEFTAEVRENQVVVETDESDVSAFLKVMIDKGARVEVYSAHDYPGTSYGRGG